METIDDSSLIYQNPVRLLQRLVQFDTTNPPGNESECISFINHLLAKASVETKVLARSPERPNLIARLPGQGNAPPLLLYGHVDVVTTEKQQWQHPPFEGKLVDGYVWGRGTLDMKGGIAMMLTTLIIFPLDGLVFGGSSRSVLASEINMLRLGAGVAVSVAAVIVLIVGAVLGARQRLPRRHELQGDLRTG